MKCFAIIVLALCLSLPGFSQARPDKKDLLFSDTTKYSIFNYYRHCIVEAIFVADQDYPDGITVKIFSGSRVIDTQVVPRIKKGERNIKIVKYQ